MPMNIKMILFLMVSLTFSCSNDSSETLDENPAISNHSDDLDTIYFPPKTTNTWEKITVSELGWNTSSEKDLYDYLETKDSKAFIILKNGRIVIEKYFNGHTSTDSHPWYSAGKTLTSFTIGIAKQEEFLNINNSSATYIGPEWANITPEQETQITVKNHLTMTTGLNYNVSNQNCTDSTCLTYLNQPSTFWYYHNATYTLLQSIIEGATGQNFESYFDAKLKNKIGMTGKWINIGYASIFYSTARSMARFGLLNLNKGIWDNETILSDQNYFNEMTTTSQQMNQAYGYLWWLNGKSSFRAPSFETRFQGKLIPNAPDDLIAGLGKDDQKLYVVPSQNLVIVRMGGDTGEALLGPSSFDNDLWKKINALIGI